MTVGRKDFGFAAGVNLEAAIPTSTIAAPSSIVAIVQTKAPRQDKRPEHNADNQQEDAYRVWLITHSIQKYHTGNGRHDNQPSNGAKNLVFTAHEANSLCEAMGGGKERVGAGGTRLVENCTLGRESSFRYTTGAGAYVRSRLWLAGNRRSDRPAYISEREENLYACEEGLRQSDGTL